MDMMGRAGVPFMGTHVAAAAHLLALIAAILLLVWTIRFGGGLDLHSANLDRVFNVHPVVMFMGFIFVSGEAIMAFKIVRAPKKVQKLVHMLLQLLALSLGIFGVSVAFKYHRKSHIQHMTSLHSWLGIVTICLFGLQWLFGFFFFWFPRAPTPTRAKVAPLHAYAGLAIFLLTVCTAETGLVEKSAEPGMESRLVNFTGLFMLLFALAVSICAALPRVITAL